MRIVWLSVNTSYAHSSLSLPLLHRSAVAAEHVDTWKAVEATPHRHVPNVFAEIADAAPDIILGTCYLFNRDFLLRVLQRVKTIHPECTVILGGPEFWTHNESFLRTAPYVDAVIRGEGEAVIGDMLKKLRKGEDKWDDLSGVCRLTNGDSVYCDNGTAMLSQKELEGLPPPAEDEFFDFQKPFQQLETSRGCIGRCTFCTSSLLPGTRKFPVERVQRELDIFRRMGVREVRVLDRTFNEDPRRCVQLLEMFRTHYPDMRFHLEIHPAFLTPAVREQLALFPPENLHLEAGIQTLSYAPRKSVGRPGEKQSELEGLHFLCTATNRNVHVDLLAGLPQMSLDDVLSDIHTTVNLDPDEIQLEILKALPGTSLAEHAASYRICASPAPPYEVLQTEHMSCQQLQTATQYSKILDDYYNNKWFKDTFQRIVGRTQEFLPSFRSYLANETGHPLDTPLSLKRRFILLHTFLEQHYPPETPEKLNLEINWLRAGLSASHGLRSASKWKHPVPPDASLENGTASLIQTHNVRVWHISQPDAERWVVVTPENGSAVYRRACRSELTPEDNRNA